MAASTRYLELVSQALGVAIAYRTRGTVLAEPAYLWHWLNTAIFKRALITLLILMLFESILRGTSRSKARLCGVLRF